MSTHSLRAIYSSPLRRAYETAERIARPYGLPVLTIDDDHRSRRRVLGNSVAGWRSARRNRICYASFQRDPAQYGYRDGENLRQVADRVIPAIESTLQSHLGEHIAIVGHNVVNRVFLAHAIQLPLSLARGIAQDNCGINTLRLSPSPTQSDYDQFDLSPVAGLTLVCQDEA